MCLLGKILNSWVQILALHEAVSSSVNGVELAAQELCPGRHSILPFLPAQPRDGMAGAGDTEHCALRVEKGCNGRALGFQPRRAVFPVKATLAT